ncbi:MAG TPA: uroporphyrinogen decarboxylase [Candidatus Obscuribacterales bacterium]
MASCFEARASRLPLSESTSYLPAGTPGRGSGETDALLTNSPFIKACRREPVEYTPVWLMRQAGRFMPEYREIRAKVGFLELCKNPDLAAQVTVMAVEKLAVDAAIIFADLLLPLEPMGVGLAYGAGDGPRIERPVRSPADVERLHDFAVADSLAFVLEAVRTARNALPPHIPLIGFAGAPFTLAAYLVEGGASRNYENTKAFMYRHPAAWSVLMSRLADISAAFLSAQAGAGAQAVQLFDSWVGCLSEEDYRTFALPYSQKAIAGVTAGVPVIHFGTGTPHLLELMRQAGGNVIGLDWRVSLDTAWHKLGYDVAVQGNLDPAVLLSEPDEIRRRVGRILEQAGGRPGHIFNLGHGVLPGTPFESVKLLVETVHEMIRR